MQEWQELAQTVIMALICAFLVSKLISIVLQFKADDFKLVRQEAAPPPEEDSDLNVDVVEEFIAAADFVAGLGSDGRVIADEDRLELLGLFKMATEGPCESLQPAETETEKWEEWNAWSRLGSMSVEEATKTYIAMVTELYPSWKTGSTSKNKGGDEIRSISDAR